MLILAREGDKMNNNREIMKKLKEYNQEEIINLVN